jgi:hypothetical protein
MLFACLGLNTTYALLLKADITSLLIGISAKSNSPTIHHLCNEDIGLLEQVSEMMVSEWESDVVRKNCVWVLANIACEDENLSE